MTKRQNKGLTKVQRKQVKTLIGQREESKSKENNTFFIDSSITNSSPMTRSLSDLLITKGDDSDNRDGDSVRFKKLQLRLECDANQLSSNNNPYVRVILFQINDIYPNGIPNHPLQFLPRQSEAQAVYKLIYDRIHYIGDFEGSMKFKFLKINVSEKKLKYKRITWDSTDTTGSDIAKGNIFCHICTSNSVSDSLRVYMKMRLYWTE